MTPLQILDRLAFCIGYVVIGGVAMVIVAYAVLVIKIGLQRDDEKRQDD